LVSRGSGQFLYQGIQGSATSEYFRALRDKGRWTGGQRDMTTRTNFSPNSPETTLTLPKQQDLEKQKTATGVCKIWLHFVVVVEIIIIIIIHQSGITY
jgi:hypothetical protein